MMIMERIASSLTYSRTLRNSHFDGFTIVMTFSYRKHFAESKIPSEKKTFESIKLKVPPKTEDIKMCSWNSLSNDFIWWIRALKTFPIILWDDFNWQLFDLKCCPLVWRSLRASVERQIYQDQPSHCWMMTIIRNPLRSTTSFAFHLFSSTIYRYGVGLPFLVCSFFSFLFAFVYARASTLCAMLCNTRSSFKLNAGICNAISIGHNYKLS